MVNDFDKASGDRLEQLFNGIDKWRPSRYNLFAPIPGTDLVAGINLLSGSCDAYSKAELYLLKEVEFLNNEHPIMNRFKNRGLIVNYDELEALESMGRLSTAAPYYASMTICPTMACNFDCPYCFVDHVNSTMSDKVQDETIALCEKLLDASNTKQLRIRWFGGEPLLRTDIIEEMSNRLMKISSDRGVEYKAWMYTNGYLFTQDIADMLGRCGVDHVTITIDGKEATHDKTRRLVDGGSTFARITENLRTIRFPFRVNIRQNLHEGNVSEALSVKALVEDLIKESGNDYRYVTSSVKTLHMKDKTEIHGIDDENLYMYNVKEAAKWFEPSHSIFCDAGNMWSVAVNSKGRLFRCWEQLDDDRYSFAYVGKWDPTNPIRTADQPDLFSVFLNDSVRSNNDKCKDCVWLPLCLGGCPLFRLDRGEKCLPWKDHSEDYVLEVYKRSLERSNSLE